MGLVFGYPNMVASEKICHEEKAKYMLLCWLLYNSCKTCYLPSENGQEWQIRPDLMEVSLIKADFSKKRGPGGIDFGKTGAN